jgi:hypothetical protein
MLTGAPEMPSAPEMPPAPGVEVNSYVQPIGAPVVMPRGNAIIINVVGIFAFGFGVGVAVGLGVTVG